MALPKSKSHQVTAKSSSSSSRLFDVLDYYRAGSEDINKTRGGEMSA